MKVFKELFSKVIWGLEFLEVMMLSGPVDSEQLGQFHQGMKKNEWVGGPGKEGYSEVFSLLFSQTDTHFLNEFNIFKNFFFPSKLCKIPKRDRIVQ